MPRHLFLDDWHAWMGSRDRRTKRRPGTAVEQLWGWSEPLREDSTDCEVSWTAGDLSRFVGWPRTLRIKMRHADLYSFCLSKRGSRLPPNQDALNGAWMAGRATNPTNHRPSMPRTRRKFAVSIHGDS